MTIPEVEALATGGEPDTLGLKASTGQRSEAAGTACGMLNRDGGVVLFGVPPDGRVQGQPVGDRTLEDVVRGSRKIEPCVPISPATVLVSGGRSVIVLTVPQGGTGRTPVRNCLASSTRPRAPGELASPPAGRART